MDKYTNMPHGRFYRAYDALAEAYMNDRLEPFNPCCCFVGNLVAKACGFQFNSSNEWAWVNPTWDEAPTTYLGSKLNEPPERYMPQIEPTGYSVEEIGEMERIFMEVSNRRNNNWNAVMATFEYLYSLEAWSEEEKISANNLLQQFKYIK